MATASSATVEPIGLSQERIQRNLALHRAAAVADYDACVALLQPSQQEHEHEPIDTWYEDPQQHAWSALHFAADVGSLPIVKLLLMHGAIWNAVDAFGTTAAEVAWSRNHNKCYEAIFNEGVRQTVLLNLLERKDDQQQLQTQDEQPEPEVKRQKLADQSQGTATRTDPSAITLQAPANELTNSNTDFLASKLDFFPDKAGKMRCLDQDGNMVMADWESDIMQLSAELICKDQQPGFSALNVGFGLGIVDTFIQNYKPGRHVIIEPHPDALAYMRKLGWHNKPGVEIFEGRWEDWIRDDDSDESIEKMTQLGSFDAIYWDTYSQDYKDIRKFFECLPNLLTGPEAKFSFFHGLAATNPFFYDVYTRVSELDLKDIGLTTRWVEMNPKCKEEEWEGVRRKYWSLETYRCPVSWLDVY